MLVLLFDLFFFILSLFALLKVVKYYKSKGYLTEKADERYWRISVIIPARNEANRIRRLLDSLMKQTYSPYEVIVVDDDSSDGTGKLVSSYGFRLIKVKPPSRWTGKCFALYSGAKEATGDILLFLDADTWLDKNFLGYFKDFIEGDKILTIQPYHEVLHFYEHFSMLLNLISFIGVEVGAGKRSYNVKRGLFGPCIFFPRKIYTEIGGHELVKNSLIEDMDLGLKLREMGFEVLALPHNGLIKYRMYSEGLLSLIKGWVKNFSRGARRSSFFTILQVVSLVAFYFGGLKALFLPPSETELRLLYAFMWIIYLLAFYLAVSELGSFKWWDVLLLPLHYVFFILVFTVSIIFAVFNIPIDWRGRRV
ncbi:MAG: glycosyltransferase [Candidatus Hydrothermia bacterium]